MTRPLPEPPPVCVAYLDRLYCVCDRESAVLIVAGSAESWRIAPYPPRPRPERREQP